MNIFGTTILALAATAAVADAQSLGKEGQKQPVSPQAATGYEMILYRVSGVADNGDIADRGIATTFHCTNLGTVAELLRIRLFGWTGTIEADVPLQFPAKTTHSISTHYTTTYSDDFVVNVGQIAQGHAAIFGTSVNFACSAMVVNAGALGVGTDLHMVRYNPIPGTTE